MIVALVGPSACGKTTHAEILGREFGIPVRHCGDEIRAAAGAVGLTLNTCTDEIHRQVDRETVEWCEALQSSLGVVEGRFLDQVLSLMSGTTFIQFTAPEDERAKRLTERMGKSIDTREVQELDREDDLFRQRMYSSSPIAPKLQVIDTGGGTAPECVKNLISLVRELSAQQLG